MIQLKRGSYRVYTATTPRAWFSKNSSIRCIKGFYSHPAMKGVCSPLYRMRILTGEMSSCSSHSDSRGGPDSSSGLFLPFCYCGKRQRGVEDRNRLLKTSRGKKEGNAQRNKAVQSSFQTHLTAATHPSNNPINQGRGRGPAA